MFFKRALLLQLLAWKNAKKRKPLILKGARQVGKTSLLKEFGAKYFTDVAYFNFEEQPSLKQFFENTKEVKRILQNLSLIYGKPIKSDDTLIIFDEIQECNDALNALKYFHENAPEYAVVSAGSLLGITLGKKNSFPVGKVEFMEVHPLSFKEFLAAADDKLFNYLESIEEVNVIPDIFFNHILEKFKLYFISGGMPEPAKTLIEDSDIQLTQKRLKDILSGYHFDFSKHASPSDISKITYVWQSIPSQLARENKKFLYQTVKSGARAREYEDALMWLINAGLVYKVNRCITPHLPLSANDDIQAFKLYLLDVGLLKSLAQLDTLSLLQGDAMFIEFKGSLTENYILQSLINQFDVAPRYWTSEGKAEVDFLLQYNNNIYPVEVKAGESIKSKSLTFYAQKHQPKLRIRYSLRNLSYNDGLLNIPLFLADYSKNFIDKIIQ